MKVFLIESKSFQSLH